MPSESPTPTTPQWAQSFKESFCRAHSCPEWEYERRAFRLCLYPHTAPFASLLLRLNPEFFREDFEVLREISEVRDIGTLKQELSRFYGRNLRDKNWLRSTFYLRISGKRIIALNERINPPQT